MYIVQDYSLAVIFCVVTMLCWGSWGNTQKLASKTWRYEFFYWDYVIGVLLFSLISGFTLGSIGTLSLPDNKMEVVTVDSRTQFPAGFGASESR